MKPGASTTERFTGWYLKAIEKLKELPEGDGGFAALMIAFPLYERLTVARLKRRGVSATEDAMKLEIAADLKLDDRQRSLFWSVFRIGFTHQAMGKSGESGWLVSDKFGATPEFRALNGQTIVCLDPWKFADRVIAAFLSDPEIIESSQSFPLAHVTTITPED